MIDGISMRVIRWFIHRFYACFVRVFWRVSPAAVECYVIRRGVSSFPASVTACVRSLIYLSIYSFVRPSITAR